jgi:Transposase DDE domain
MSNIRPLEQALATNLSLNKARIKFLACFLIAILQVKTVNLTEIATAFSGTAKEQSNYKRLQRFFRLFELPYSLIADLVVKLLGISGPWTLTMDRTNWKLGLTELNILMLGIVYKGVAFPIVWLILPKAGNSNTDERILLLELFIDLFGVERIQCLLGDREFVGKRWFQWLIAQGIDFRIRAHHNYRVANGHGKLVPAWRLFAASGVDQMLVFPSPRQMWGLELYLSGCYLGKGEYLILVAPSYSEQPEEEYKKRWEIETLFGCLKTRGFNLEDTHLTDPERLSRLLGLLAIAFCWAHKVGEWRATQEPLKIKKHGYSAKSIVRYGLDCLRRILTNFDHFDLVEWTRVIKLLSCT